MIAKIAWPVVTSVILTSTSTCLAAPTPGAEGDRAPSGMPAGFQAPLSREALDKLNAAEREQKKAQAKKESSALVNAMRLSCEVTDADLIGIGNIKIDNKPTNVKAYEVACSNGMGYIVESQGAQKPLAISCFAADATRVADIAKGVKSNFYCELGANKDIKATATGLLSATGTSCVVNNVRWFGISASLQTEYTEVACDGDKGYLLKIPQIGITAISVVSCADAAKEGLQCHLTDAGPLATPVTKQSYVDAIKSHGIKCEPTQLRVIGRESVDKRYVVELQCPEQPKGLVAFIPLQGNTSPFEIIDCNAAAERQIQCKLTAK